jgi:parallel beta-helix repeat protein
MSKRVSIFILIILTLTLLQSQTFVFQIRASRTWTVDDNGPADFSSIQAAINAASNGDEVYVKNGNYNEKIIIDKSISLIGENRDDVIITYPFEFEYNGAIEVKTNDVIIKGFTIDSFNVFNPRILLSNVERVTIENNKIYSLEMSTNIMLNYCSNCKIYNNDLKNGNDGMNIGVYNSNSNIIMNNKIIGALYCDGEGIYLINSNDDIIKDNLIKNNQFGIRMKSCINTEIIDNDIYKSIEQTSGGIYAETSTSILIRNNNITDNHCWGIRLINTNQCEITYNLIKDNGQPYAEPHSYGISLETSFNNHIYFNNLINNGDGNLYNSGSSYSNILDDGYPNGGNYWSDYTGSDTNHGPSQNLAGSDEIGDTPLIIDSSNIDHYPLMTPLPLPMEIPETPVPENPLGSALTIGTMFVILSLFLVWRK